MGRNGFRSGWEQALKEYWNIKDRGTGKTGE
jgi:hypothetical protein